MSSKFWIALVLGNVLFLGLLAGIVIWFFMMPSDESPTLVAGTPSAASPLVGEPVTAATGSEAGAPVQPSPHVARRVTPDNSPSAQGAESASGQGPLTVAEVIERVDGGVVHIECFDASGNRISIGSGFLVDPAGLLATNFHVLQRASTARATFHDGRSVDVAGCRAWDEKSDLALLQLQEVPPDVEVLPLCRHTQRKQADEVIAIGHPQGFRFTTTTGIISAIQRTADLPEPYRSMVRAPAENVWIQTNAAISGGNSGGPLLTRDGQVVGISTWVAQGQNLGFAADIRHLIELQSKLNDAATPLADLTGPDETLARLATDFNTQRSWLMSELMKVGSREEAEKLLATRHPALEFVAKFYELADQHRGRPVASKALQSLVQIASLPDCPAECGSTIKLACDRILEDHGDDTDFIATVLNARTTRLEELRDFLRQLSEVSGNESLRALSLFALATSLQSKGDPQETARSVELLERIVAEYPEVRVGGAALKQVVEPALFRTKHLSIGSQPPDITGRDQDGVEFRLSDYRGKVVVLDFWADWCPHCQAMYPLERELVEKYADQPFAVLGVNCDEPARFQRVVASKQVTWRNWADGPQGPISRQYRIESFPTIYVLDHEGVIRYKNVRGQQLVDAVAELVAKAASPDPPSAMEEQRAEATLSSESSAAASRTFPLRTWTTKDGRQAKLRFVALEGETVRFTLENGREAQVPLARLSDEDQAWIRRQQED